VLRSTEQFNQVFRVPEAALELARRHFAEALRAGPPLHSPAATREFLVARRRDIPHELFCCLYLYR
jgi:DNA repair protein RadC